MTEDLDSTLYEGKEVTAVYNEIMKILPNEHMFLESVSAILTCSTPEREGVATILMQEPTLEPSLTRPVNLSKIFASTTLHHRRSRRVVNKDLHRSIPCPWADTLSKKEWEGVYENLCTYCSHVEIGFGVDLLPSHKLSLEIIPSIIVEL